MADRLSADPDRMRSASYGFDDCASRVDKAVMTLREALREAGQCWGRDDEVAHAFQKEYVPNQDKALSAADRLAFHLNTLGIRAREVAKAYESAETANHRAASASVAVPEGWAHVERFHEQRVEPLTPDGWASVSGARAAGEGVPEGWAHVERFHEQKVEPLTPDLHDSGSRPAESTRATTE